LTSQFLVIWIAEKNLVTILIQNLAENFEFFDKIWIFWRLKYKKFIFKSSLI
jgi:hypothetical protein